MAEARQNSSKLAEMFDRASSFNALVGMAVDVVSLFMALLSSVESAPRAYRLKASNAASPFSTSIGTIPFMTSPSAFAAVVCCTAACVVAVHVVYEICNNVRPLLLRPPADLAEAVGFAGEVRR